MSKVISPLFKATKIQIPLIRSWFKSEKGAYFLSLEQPMIDEAINYYFGRFLLQAGPLFSITTATKHMTEIISVGEEGSEADIICQEHAWPILTESVECVVLHHSLDFAHSPHDLLREAARCIRPGGHVLIVGFNPYSAWGMYRHFTSSILNKSHALSYNRLTDWLKLLGFFIERRWTGAYSLPRNYGEKRTKLEAVGQRQEWFGNGFYIVSARKLMIKQTPLENKRHSILGSMTPIPVVNRNDAKINDR